MLETAGCTQIILVCSLPSLWVFAFALIFQGEVAGNVHSSIGQRALCPLFLQECQASANVFWMSRMPASTDPLLEQRF